MVGSIHNSVRLQFIADGFIDLSPRGIVWRHDQSVSGLQRVALRYCFEPRMWLGDLGDAPVLLQNRDTESGFMSRKMLDGFQQFRIFLSDDLIELCCVHAGL